MNRYANLDTDVLQRVIARYEKVLKGKQNLLTRVAPNTSRARKLAREAEAYRALLKEAREELGRRALPTVRLTRKSLNSFSAGSGIERLAKIRRVNPLSAPDCFPRPSLID
jgi:hypothetical protein